MNKGRNVFSQLCDLLIEQKEEESPDFVTQKTRIL